MIIYFRFDFIYFVQFNLHLIGRKVNLQAVIFKRIKFDKKSIFFFFVRFLCSIWGVCPTRRGVSHESEANHKNICLVVDYFRGEIHQSREAGPPERPQSRLPTAPQKIQGCRKPSFSSLFASQTTRAPTRWRLRSEVRSLYPGRCWPRGALGRRQPTHDIPRAIASYPMLAKRVCRWPRRSGEEALRRSPRWLPTGVSWPCALLEFRTQTGPSSIPGTR